jgi:hypothetical protein
MFIMRIHKDKKGKDIPVTGLLIIISNVYVQKINKIKKAVKQGSAKMVAQIRIGAVSYFG